MLNPAPDPPPLHPVSAIPERTCSSQLLGSKCFPSLDSAFTIPCILDGSRVGAGRGLPISTLWLEYLNPGSPRGKLGRVATVWERAPIQALPRPWPHSYTSAWEGRQATAGWGEANCLSMLCSAEAEPQLFQMRGALQAKRLLGQAFPQTCSPPIE